MAPLTSEKFNLKLKELSGFKKKQTKSPIKEKKTRALGIIVYFNSGVKILI